MTVEATSPWRQPSVDEMFRRWTSQGRRLAPPALAWVVPLDGPRTGETVLLRIINRVGRDPDNDLQLEVDGVGAHHARIELLPSGYVLLDLGTWEGTCVNGQRIERAALTDGDLITFASCRVRFKTLYEPDERKAS